MDVKQAPRLQYGREYARFQAVDAFGLGVVQDPPHDLGFGDVRILPGSPALGLLELTAPTKADQAIALGDQLGPAQAKADVVPPAQSAGMARTSCSSSPPRPCSNTSRG